MTCREVRWFRTPNPCLPSRVGSPTLLITRPAVPVRQQAIRTHAGFPIMLINLPFLSHSVNGRKRSASLNKVRIEEPPLRPLRLIRYKVQTLPSTPANAKLTSSTESFKASLIADLLQEIADPANKKQSIMRLSAFLVRLGSGAPARDAFLLTRAELMRKRARMIRFEGNISLYIAELALVTFTGIRHTSEWYLASFREHDMASGEPPDREITCDWNHYSRHGRLGQDSSGEVCRDVQASSIWTGRRPGNRTRVDPRHQATEPKGIYSSS